VFFALSGYLITSLLLSESARYGAVGFLRFFGRRGLRLVPAVVLMLAIVTVITAVVHGPHANYVQIPYILFYFENWIKALHPVYNAGWYGHMWSLSVEEQFYLVWPAVLFIALRASRKKAIIACIVGMAISLVLRIAFYHGISDLSRIFYGTDTVGDDLLAGCLGALLLWQATPSQEATLRRALRWLFWPAAAWLIAELVALPSVSHPSTELTLYITGGRTIEALTSAIVVAAVAIDVAPRWVLWLLASPPLVMLGRISYGFYLWHVPLLYLLGLDVTRIVQIPVALVGSVMIATLSFHLVERPLQRRFRARVSAGGPHCVADIPTEPSLVEPLRNDPDGTRTRGRRG
jgi:peptidoglycan/LPS O-acetylase OafA/YrhL